jgi:type II secretory pathway pseudopilin PulG
MGVQVRHIAEKGKPISWLRYLVIGTPLILLGGCWSSILLLKKTSQASLNAKLDELAARGFPIDDVGAVALHQQSSTTIDQQLWVEVIDALRTPAILSEYAPLPIIGRAPDVPPLGQPWREQVPVEQFLARHADTLNLLLSISQNNGPVQLPIKFNSSATRLPYTQDMRTAARILLLEVALATRIGDAEREFRGLNSILGCAIALQGEPFLVSNLASVAIFSLALPELQAAIVGDRLHPEQLALLQKRVQQCSNLLATKIALRGEFYNSVQSIRNLDLNDSGLKLPPVIGDLLVNSGIADRAALKYLQVLESAVDLPMDDLHQWRDQMSMLELSFGRDNFLFAPAEKIAGACIPALSAFATAQIRHKMAADLVVLALAIRRFEKSQGRLPGDLNQLSEYDIDLTKFLLVDGDLPRYQLLPPADLSAGQPAIRAVLWGLDQRTASNATISSTPPVRTPDATNPPTIWVWEFE